MRVFGNFQNKKCQICPSPPRERHPKEGEPGTKPEQHLLKKRLDFSSYSSPNKTAPFPTMPAPCPVSPSSTPSTSAPVVFVRSQRPLKESTIPSARSFGVGGTSAPSSGLPLAPIYIPKLDGGTVTDSSSVASSIHLAFASSEGEGEIEVVPWQGSIGIRKVVASSSSLSTKTGATSIGTSAFEAFGEGTVKVMALSSSSLLSGGQDVELPELVSREQTYPSDDDNDEELMGMSAFSDFTSILDCSPDANSDLLDPPQNLPEPLRDKDEEVQSIDPVDFEPFDCTTIEEEVSTNPQEDEDVGEKKIAEMASRALLDADLETSELQADLAEKTAQDMARVIEEVGAVIMLPSKMKSGHDGDSNGDSDDEGSSTLLGSNVEKDISRPCYINFSDDENDTESENSSTVFQNCASVINVHDDSSVLEESASEERVSVQKRDKFEELTVSSSCSYSEGSLDNHDSAHQPTPLVETQSFECSSDIKTSQMQVDLAERTALHMAKVMEEVTAGVGSYQQDDDRGSITSSTSGNVNSKEILSRPCYINFSDDENSVGEDSIISFTTCLSITNKPNMEQGVEIGFNPSEGLLSQLLTQSSNHSVVQINQNEEATGQDDQSPKSQFLKCDSHALSLQHVVVTASGDNKDDESTASGLSILVLSPQPSEDQGTKCPDDGDLADLAERRAKVMIRVLDRLNKNSLSLGNGIVDTSEDECDEERSCRPCYINLDTANHFDEIGDDDFFSVEATSKAEGEDFFSIKSSRTSSHESVSVSESCGEDNRSIRSISSLSSSSLPVTFPKQISLEPVVQVDDTAEVFSRSFIDIPLSSSVDEEPSSESCTKLIAPDVYPTAPIVTQSIDEIKNVTNNQEGEEMSSETKAENSTPLATSFTMATGTMPPSPPLFSSSSSQATFGETKTLIVDRNENKDVDSLQEEIPSPEVRQAVLDDSARQVDKAERTARRMCVVMGRLWGDWYVDESLEGSERDELGSWEDALSDEQVLSDVDQVLSCELKDSDESCFDEAMYTSASEGAGNWDDANLLDGLTEILGRAKTDDRLGILSDTVTSKLPQVSDSHEETQEQEKSVPCGFEKCDTSLYLEDLKNDDNLNDSYLVAISATAQADKEATDEIFESSRRMAEIAAEALGEGAAFAAAAASCSVTSLSCGIESGGHVKTDFVFDDDSEELDNDKTETIAVVTGSIRGSVCGSVVVLSPQESYEIGCKRHKSEVGISKNPNKFGRVLFFLEKVVRTGVSVALPQESAGRLICLFILVVLLVGNICC